MGPTWNGSTWSGQPEMALTWNGPNLKWPDITWNGLNLKWVQPEMAQPEVANLKWPTWNGPTWSGLYPKPKSLSVRSGCALQVFTKENCQGKKFLFIAPQNTYIKNHGNNFAVKTLRDSITYNFCNSYIYKTITRFETFPFRWKYQMYQMLLYDLKSFGQFYFCEFLLNTKIMS